jgi:hypothetical protein
MQSGIFAGAGVVTGNTMRGAAVGAGLSVLACNAVLEYPFDFPVRLPSAAIV